MSVENIDAALKEAERVCKKQRICAAKTTECLEALLQEVTAAQLQLSNSVNGTNIVQELSQRLSRPDAVKELSDSTKDLHSAVNKLGKAMDKAFVQDICTATRPMEFDQGVLNQVIAEHLYQQGHFRVGDTFVREAGVADGDALKAPYTAMHTVLKEACARSMVQSPSEIKRHALEQIMAHRLEPAQRWAAEHRAALVAASGESAVAAFEFRLHRLQFLHTLQTAGSSRALAYARAHFGAFQESELGDIQRLMGCLCFVRRPPGASPYADLMAPGQWADAAREFSRQCCGLLGQACESPLLVAVAAGSIALPTLLKLATVIAAQNQDFLACAQLPVELELGREFVFHSVFACPVSREQSSADNPPMLLPCGHVLAKQSLQKIAKSPVRAFKCPYCPVEATLNSCRAIFFPDA